VSREKTRPRDNDKAQRDFRINRTEQLASRARRTERALEALDEVEKPWEGWELRFAIKGAARAGAVVCRLEDAVINRGAFTLGPLTLEIGWAERVALIGPNGSGKTTLVAALLGRIELRSGRRLLGPSVVVGELGQDRRVLGGGGTVVDALVSLSGLTLSAARSQLAKFGIAR
jgi:ATPase subunit of ABC transporter with duplicated ATPase domains